MKTTLGRNKNGQLIILKLQTPHKANEDSPSKSGKISDKHRLPVSEKVQPAWLKNLDDVTFLYTREAKPVVDTNPLIYRYHLRKLDDTKRYLGR